ncbi:CU044_5270 family protein [Curtobacterium flaccumfaciens]|uniref:CU044_5270 family protein n=1 Tax=Curtobacterium TaxID=2034 RepID=UPI0011B547FC|nr:MULTISPECIES: CU044_5270 family protein [Curtobacterium]MCS6558585.1 CU044_5270 family protein [Curtobacterium flaccumfaciens]
MDELTLLRSVRNSEAAADADALARGRTKLLAHISAADDAPATAPSSRRRSVVRRVRWFGGGSLVAGGVAAALVVGNVTGFAGLRGGADPAAADVLNDAASTTITTSDPVVGAGQYLEVATHAAAATQAVTADGSATYLASQDGQLYIPADTTSTWVWVREPEAVVKTFGAASKEAAADTPRAKGEYLRADGGSFYGAPAAVSPADLKELSRDPAALLRHIYTVTNGQGRSRDGEALVWIADTLRSGIVPADLRAALYKAAAGIPGVELTDKQANLEGQTGVAIGRTESDGTRHELIIDPTTGLMIGEREVATGKAATGFRVPDGTAVGWTAVTTAVVDTAPGKGTK